MGWFFKYLTTSYINNQWLFSFIKVFIFGIEELGNKTGFSI